MITAILPQCTHSIVRLSVFKQTARKQQAMQKFDKVQGTPLGSQGVTVGVADAVDVDSEGAGVRLDKD